MSRSMSRYFSEGSKSFSRVMSYSAAGSEISSPLTSFCNCQFRYLLVLVFSLLLLLLTTVSRTTGQVCWKWVNWRDCGQSLWCGEVLFINLIKMIPDLLKFMSLETCSNPSVSNQTSSVCISKRFTLIVSNCYFCYCYQLVQCWARRSAVADRSRWASSNSPSRWIRTCA